MSAATRDLLARAAAALKAAGAREVYVFGSAVSATEPRDIDLAVSGLPPGDFYRVGARLERLLDRTVDLVDLDQTTPFTRHLREAHELVRLG